MIAAFLFLICGLSPDPQLHSKMRQEFKEVLSDSKKAESFIQSHQRNQSELAKAYKAAATAIMAEDGFNPYSKFQLFKEGTNDLDNLIRQNEKNIEMRFLRVMIQKEAPSFLGYHGQIAEDLESFVSHYHDYSLCDFAYKRYMLGILKVMFAEQKSALLKLDKLK